MKLREQNNNAKAIWQIIHLKLWDLKENIFIREVFECSDVGTYWYKWTTSYLKHWIHIYIPFNISQTSYILNDNF